MAEVILSQRFEVDYARIQSADKRNKVAMSLVRLETFPNLGPLAVSTYLRNRFGSGVRKLVVHPFDIIYRYDSDKDVVQVLGIIHQRQVK